jgi:putative glycosyltransferase (TIGR04372 family)
MGGVLGRFRDPVWRTIVFAVSLVEVPLFLIRNRAIFRNRILFPFWHWSFGHAITGVDYASRLYWPHRISLLYLPHPNSNPLVPRLFEHNVDVFPMRSVLGFRSVRIDMPRFAVLRFFALVLAGLRLKHYVIERLQIYRTLAVTTETLLAGRPDVDRAEAVIDYTGYVRLLRDGVGQNAALPPDLAEACRLAIDDRFPDFFDRPFVALVLRRKGQGLELHTALRDAGPPASYVPAVRWLVENGFHVVPWGTETEAFRGLPGVYPLADLETEREALNLFAFTRCAFFVGQQSGAPVLANAAGVPCLIVDAFPYSVGTFRRGDVMLFKQFVDEETDRPLSVVEVFRDHADLAFGYNLAARGVRVEPNSPEQILDAVQEAAAVFGGLLEPSEDDERLIEAFRMLPAPSMHMAYHQNRPPLSVLRHARDELLDAEAGAAAGRT